MRRRFELLVFDWDGTLMDSAAAISESLQAACADLGLPVPSSQRARYVIGLGLNDALRNVLPDLPEAEYPRLLDRYRVQFLQRDGDTTLFPGAAEMIRDLHAAGFLLAVATGKSRAGLAKELSITGLGRLFHATRCADETFSKPHPQMLLELMDELGVHSTQTLMVGDTEYDLQMAANARAFSLAVCYGVHPPERLLACGPLACLDSVADIPGWLAGRAGSPRTIG